MAMRILSKKAPQNQRVFTVSKEAAKMSTEQCLEQIVRDYSYYEDSGYHVDIDKLDDQDAKILLSHFVDAEDYEYACENQTKFNAIWCEYQVLLQEKVDEKCAELFHYDMREMGCKLNRHSDNGEFYYSR